MKKLLATALLTLSLAIHAGLSIPPDGKMTLYYEDGSKKIEKKYKDGQPVGIWKSWHPNGKRHIQATFEITSSNRYFKRTGKFNTSITDVEVRYSNEDNSIQFKGIAFEKSDVSFIDNGTKIPFINWGNLYQSYNEQGDEYSANDVIFEMEDTTTGFFWHFPWDLEGADTSK